MKKQLVESLGVYHENGSVMVEAMKAANTLERALFIARDLGRV